MTKQKWKDYSRNKAIPLLRHSVAVMTHWNFGSTPEKRKRKYIGILDVVDEKGIILGSLFFSGGFRVSYKSLDCIEPHSL